MSRDSELLIPTKKVIEGSRIDQVLIRVLVRCVRTGLIYRDTRYM